METDSREEDNEDRNILIRAKSGSAAAGGQRDDDAGTVASILQNCVGGSIVVKNYVYREGSMSRLANPLQIIPNTLHPFDCA